MEKWIKNLGIGLLAFGIFGIIKNYNWTTIEERIALIISVFFCFIAAIISFIEWREEEKLLKH